MENIDSQIMVLLLFLVITKYFEGNFHFNSCSIGVDDEAKLRKGGNIITREPWIEFKMGKWENDEEEEWVVG